MKKLFFLPNNQSRITNNSSPSLREDDIGVGAVAEELGEEAEEEGVGFLDEGGEDAEAIGEGLHRIAEEVEHLDLAAGESAFFHALELGDVEIAFIAEFVSCHAYGPDGGDKQVVPHGFEDEDKASARL